MLLKNLFASCSSIVLLSSFAFAQDALSPLVVLGERELPSEVEPVSWDEREIRISNSRTIDALLATDPGFSLFRRQSATFANPTSSGVSLRGTGATAASRSLVLLDGIPQNDPFGGWVNWARYEPSSLGEVKIDPHGGASLWGNMSAAGTVKLTTREIEPGKNLTKITGGSQGLIAGSTSHDLADPTGKHRFRISAFGSRADGFFVVPESQRGSVDRRLWLENRGVDFLAQSQVQQDVLLDSRFSYYAEERGNGTAYTENSTEAYDLNFRLTGKNADLHWQALAYFQNRDFTSRFSTVADDRLTEDPAQNQYDVPGQGIGGGVTLDWQPDQPLKLLGGFDFRLLSGETNEDAGFVDNTFFRRRMAGGDQATAGFFTTATYDLTKNSILRLGGRLDYWSIYDGKRLERALSNGDVLKEGEPSDRDGVEPSVSLEWEQKIHDDLTFQISAGSSYRLPTLNELHRPFRVRSDVTEANPQLDPERFYTLETSIDYEPHEKVQLSFGVFHHWIRDVIANAPVTDPAQIIELFGSLPPGGKGFQRQNVSEARVLGVELASDLQATDDLSFHGKAIWSDTDFDDDLVFPQVPDFGLNLSSDYQIHEKIILSLGAEYRASVFEDASGENQLPHYWNTRFLTSWQATDKLTLRAHVENLLDEEIITGEDANGLTTVGQPRAFWLSAELKF